MPQLGAAIGGMIGGWIAPTQVNGPHIGDGAAQNSAEGQPIAWILSTAGWVQGNIVQISARREVKKTDDGKGSGTEVNTFEAHQDFCIMICESSETRDSLMTGVLIVKVDGKIVYDKREGKNFGAENAKFLKNHTFYDGNEAQLPDPTMEAITGVGNTPAYRGVYTMVARDINLSQYGERIPNYEFVMVGAGESLTVTSTSLVVPSYSSFRDDHWPLVDLEDRYTLVGNREGYTFSADSIQEIVDHFADFYGVNRPPSNYLGYSASPIDPSTSYDSVIAQPTVVDNEYVYLIYNDFEPSQFYNDNAINFCPLIPYPGPYQTSAPYADNVGNIIIMESDGSPTYPPNFMVWNNCIGLPSTGGYFPQIYGSKPLVISVRRKAFVPDPILGDPCILQTPVLLPDSPEFVIDCDGNVTPLPTYAVATGGPVHVLRNSSPTQSMLGPAIRVGAANDNQTFWEAAYNSALANGSIEAGLTYPADYPWEVPASSVFTATVTVNSISTDTISVATAITRIAVRGGLTVDDIDVSEMDQDLLGFPILQPYNGADCIRPLMTGFTSYGSEYDGKLRFHKHGEAIEVVIDPEDFIEGSETDKSTREQALEYPRLLSITAIDPTQDYIARPQTERRITPDVRAIGEETMQVPIVMTPDSQRQLAAIGMKVSWARAQGTQEFSVPYATNGRLYMYLVAGKPFALNGKRYIAASYRLEDGEIHIEAKYDRQSAYTSNVTATPALPPTPPPSSIGGVTLFAALNIGVLRDQDDRVGMYIAVDGLLDSWAGCLLQWSIDDGASWQTAIASMTQASTMGYLTAPLPLAPASGDDVTNTLSVAVHGGQLNSITRQQYLNETNPYAIVSNSLTGESEVGQFQFADETSVDHYDLTTLVRGALGSTPDAHSAGDRFVFLDSVYFLEITAAYIGRTILFRPVTFGTSPDNNASYSVLFQPAVSQTEWAPGYLIGRYGFGSSFALSVTPRHRLGNDIAPIASANFTGFRWTATDGVTTQTRDTVDPNVVFDLADFTDPVTYTVSQLNRFTGPGPSVSITV